MPPTAEDKAGAAASPASDPRPPAPLDFSTFLLSLGTSALVQLGEAPDPTQPKAERCCDLDAARQTIDLLGLLEGKTKGNLDEGESRLLQHLLTDLRFRYVQRRACKSS
jgi:hypothetical protein